MDKYQLSKLNMSQKCDLKAKAAKCLLGCISNNADNRLKKLIILCSVLVRLYLVCHIPF